MYLTLKQNELRTAVSAVQTIAGTGKTQMPILKHLVVTAEATGSITLKAANEEASIQYRVPAEVQASGTALLPAHLFAELVRDLPAAPVTLVSPSPTDVTATLVRCQRVKALIKQAPLPLEEFPQVPLCDAACRALLKVDSELLREVIEQVVFAASADSSRPILQGIRVACAGGQASFAAADAFRLAVRTIAIPDQHLEAEILIPAQTLRHLARLLPSGGAVLMALSPDGHQVLFQTREMDFASRLIEGTFPEYRSLMALQPTTRVVLPTAALIEALRLITPFARENQHHVRLRMQSTRDGEAACLVLEAEAPDLGSNEIALTEEVTVSGPDLHLRVSDTYLADALAVVPTRMVALECSQERRPITLKPVGPVDCVSIIMPLLLEQASTPAPGTAPVTSAANAR